ncbi:MAG TPA: ABC transporter permease [Dehalococcoidia bacterium]|nr:ABC transporter permease [Dehalococcoidia bacterium]
MARAAAGEELFPRTLGAEAWGPERVYPLPLRTARGLWRFTRRKPLGAFGALLIAVLLVMALFGTDLTLGPLHLPGFAPYKWNSYNLLRVQRTKLKPPSAAHVMGTDQLGRDVFSRILYGARISMGIGMGVFAISTVLSTALTLISGYYVETVDLVLQRVLEVVGFIPELILIIAVFSIYGPSPLSMILTLGVLNGLRTSRVLRAVVISVRSQPFIESAKALGARDRRIIVSHVLPNVMYLIIISATGAVAAAITIEAGLAIIGYGLDPNLPSWGNMMNASRELLRRAPYLALFPGLMIATAIFGFRLLGDALRDVLDPRLRGRGR